MNLSQADAEIVALGAEYNRGDVALGMLPNQTRETIVNRAALRSNIMPGELTNRANPTHQFHYAWCPIDDVNFFADLKDEGYRVVTESEWVSTRHEWEPAPEALRRRWGVDRHLYQRDEFLMFRNETLWKLEMERRAEGRDRGTSMQKTYESAIEDAQGKGLAVEGTVAGQSFTVPAPKQRKSVNFGG